MYYEVEPFGQPYLALTIAMQTRLVASFLTGKSAEVEEFLPKVERKRKDDDAGGSGVASKLKALITALPGVFRRIK
jgi:hypothetical protein